MNSLSKMQGSLALRTLRDKILGYTKDARYQLFVLQARVYPAANVAVIIIINQENNTAINRHCLRRGNSA